MRYQKRQEFVHAALRNLEGSDDRKLGHRDESLSSVRLVGLVPCCGANLTLFRRVRRFALSWGAPGPMASGVRSPQSKETV